MNILTPTRQQIIEVIDNLPEDAFSELVSFIGYLRYKAVETKTSYIIPIKEYRIIVGAYKK